MPVRIRLAAPFNNVRFDTKYQAFFCTFIGVQVSYVLDIINKDSSNNDIFYNECVLVIVLFAKRFERMVSAIKRLLQGGFKLLNDIVGNFKIVIILKK